MKTYIPILVLSGLLGVSSARATQTNVDATVEVDLKGVLEANFIGAGVQWSSYPWWNLLEDDWNKVFRRVEFMRLPFTRVMLDAFWYCKGFDKDGRPIYDWNTTYMKKLYKLIDWCENNGARVMIGEWGNPDGKDLTLANDDPRWARIVGDFLEHMLREKKYTCIKYYNLINEPHGWWSSTSGNWQEWKRAIDNLHKELTRRGLVSSIVLACPDADRKWTTKLLKKPHPRTQTGIYDEHWYVYAVEIEKGLLELYTRDQLRQIHRKDPGKQYVLGELGLLDDKTKDDKQLHVYDFWYGVSMADAAIQMIRGGMSGFIAWDLDDAMHFYGDGGESMNALSDTLPADAYQRRKVWGMWNILGAENNTPEDENIRPWFYPWSLISRSFPPGCQTLEVEDAGVYQLRVAAARIPAADKYHLSFAAANNSDNKRTVKIVVPKAAANVTVAKYDYFDVNRDNKVDSWPDVTDQHGVDVFPQPTETLKDADLNRGLTVTLPSRGVVILTTIEAGPPIPLKFN